LSELPAVGETASIAGAVRARRDWISLYADLAKVRVCGLVLLTTAVGFVLASGAAGWGHFGWTLLGTALSACGAAALNQCCEVARDARMRRTCQRPLPTGQLSREAAWAFGLVSAASGAVILFVFVNALTGWLAAINILIYVGVYTPLKPLTPLSTFGGGLVGALPPIIGWTGATGQIQIGALTLGALLFIWQVPHFLALAWMYREDYERAGFRMLPVVDRSGKATCSTVLVFCLLLIPVGLMVVVAGISGPTYGAGSLVLGAVLLLFALQLARTRTALSARRVFLATIAYLPLLLALMLVDRISMPRSAAARVEPAPQAAKLHLMPLNSPSPGPG
jgi:heme o synthase